MMINVKYTGTTKGFEDYYGELLCNGKVITEYYYDPGRYIKVFKTRKLFNDKQVSDPTLEGLCKRVLLKIKGG